MAIYKGEPSCRSTLLSPKKSRSCTKVSPYIEVHHISQSPQAALDTHTGQSMYTLIKVCDTNNDIQKIKKSSMKMLVKISFLNYAFPIIRNISINI